MNVGIIGLGKMGSIIVHRLRAAGHTVFGYDKSTHACLQAHNQGVTIVSPLEMPQHVRVVWLMLPAGDGIDTVIEHLLPSMHAGDVIIDGGNSFFKDSIRRAHALHEQEIAFLDCGTSGGVDGKEQGFALTVGGREGAYRSCEPLFQAIAAPHAFAHVGPSGAGHYVKMVHNGIEYALLYAYAQGFQLLKHGYYKDVDLAQLSAVWNNAAVIRSYLLGLMHEIFAHDQTFTDISGEVDETGMGAWTVAEAHERNVSVTLIEQAVELRKQSRTGKTTYASQLVAMMRHRFGGHPLHKKR